MRCVSDAGVWRRHRACGSAFARYRERLRRPLHCASNKCCLLLILFLSPLHAVALETVHLSVDNLEAAGLRAKAVDVELLLGKDGELAFNAAAASLKLDAAGQTLAPVRVECPQAELKQETIRCSGGRLLLGHSWLDRKGMSVNFAWRRADAHLHVELQGLGLAGGRWSLTLDADDTSRKLVARGHEVDLARLKKLLEEITQGAGADIELSGRSGIELELTLDDAGVRSAHWRLSPKDAGFSANKEAYLGEGLSLGLEGSLRRTGFERMQGELDLVLRQGALLTPFFYLEPGGQAVRLRTDFAWEAKQKSLSLDNILFRHPQVIEARAEAGLYLGEAPALTRLKLQTGHTVADALYQACFKPLLTGTLLENVRWHGDFKLDVEQKPGGVPRMHMHARGLGLEDTPDPVLQAGLHPRFALFGLSGELYWVESGEGKDTRLTWERGHLLGALEFSRTELAARLNGRSFTLSKPLELPLLDGKLLVDRLDLAAGEKGSPQLDFDGVLTPVTLQRLSDAFDWPPLSGKVSGVLPGLSLNQGVLRMDGNLLVRVFDGNILIKDLRLSDIFGVLPVMQADIRLNGMDLNELTRTFSFGKITGRLDGRIAGLRMEAWQPVAFDARFETPAGDESDHIINQRAVDNISNLGGAGIAGALSRSFLGLFEEFGYARLGIGCHLRNGVCRMSGVEPAKQGYYLVVGSGIPQINIVGFNNQADWDRLVQQLQQINAGGSPVIQ